MNKNEAEYIHTYIKEHADLKARVGQLGRYILVEEHTREEIIEKFERLFPAWKGYRGVKKLNV